jgi:Tol biopolymer transport system component
MVAFIVGGASQSYTQLWVQDFRSRSARRLEDAEGALLLFWSPDSGRIGFFANGKLKTIAASGGRAEVVCDAPNGRGGAWTASNVIVFAPDITGPLSRVDARGGAPEPLTTLDLGRQQSGHRFPLMLPDGVHFLFAAIPSRNGQFDVFAGSLGGGQPVFVTAMESAPAYADPGWLLYGRQGALVAQPFDPETLKLSGAIVPLDDEPTVILGGRPWTAGRPVTASTTGSLAYFSAPSIKSRLTWMEASGRITPAFEIPAGHYESVTISPDGSQAVLMRSSAPSEASLWLADIARGSTSLFASGPGRNELPVWSPEGKRVAFATDRDGPQNIVVKTVGEDEEHTILRSAVLFKDPASWSSDGKWLVLGHVDPVTGRNIYRMPASGGELTPLVRGPGVDRAGPVSPNGRWLAYITDESGRNQLYVQPFPDSGRRVPVSNDSAVSSWWTDDNAALLFTSADLRTLWRAEISPGDPVRVGAVKQLADLPANVIAIDAMPDRQRFLVITPERPGPGSITVVQNWRAGLGSAAPASPR